MMSKIYLLTLLLLVLNIFAAFIPHDRYNCTANATSFVERYDNNDPWDTNKYLLNYTGFNWKTG